MVRLGQSKVVVGRWQYPLAKLLQAQLSVSVHVSIFSEYLSFTFLGSEIQSGRATEIT